MVLLAVPMLGYIRSTVRPPGTRGGEPVRRW